MGDEKKCSNERDEGKPRGVLREIFRIPSASDYFVAFLHKAATSIIIRKG